MSLVCRDLHFTYNGKPVLTAVDLEVGRGEFCVLLGRNGSGKTTLIYCLAGLLRPQQGRVCIDDLDLRTAPRAEVARRVSLVPQEHTDIFPFRVLDVVVMGRTASLRFAQRPGPEDYRAARRVLADLEAESLAGRNFNRISGGERRIALLARAILQAEDTLLLDEPTNHLDFNNKYRLLETIKQFCLKKGTRVVASLHDPNLAARFADTVVMLSGGRVLASGRADEVMTPALVSRLYQTPTRRVETEDGAILFVPCPSGKASAEKTGNCPWT
jgi:iron complex transport system ATP-binding protein